jgi:hypothetical protein
LSRLTRHARNRFRRAPTGQPSPKKKARTGHSDSSRFDPWASSCRKNHREQAMKRLVSIIGIEQAVLAGTFPSTPRSRHKAASPLRLRVGRSVRNTQRAGSEASQKSDAPCVLGLYHRGPDHAPLIRTALAEQQQRSVGETMNQMKTKCGKPTIGVCVTHEVHRMSPR